jgi:osmotically inducible protein OsmC
METITQISCIIYTAKTCTSGGREHGVARSSDGRLDIRLSTPGTNRAGTNPEQLFAAGWSACFGSAMNIAANKRNISLHGEVKIGAEVDLCTDKGQYFLQARMYINIPGMEHDATTVLVDEARRICPYTKAINGNINIEFHIV